MRLELTGRHVEITPALRRLVDRKLKKLDRKLKDAVVSVQVVLTQDKYRRVSEITLHARGDHMLHGLASASTWEASLGDTIEKIGQQAETLKGKWNERKRRAISTKVTAARAAAPGAEEPPRPRVLRAARYPVKPMTVEEAALEVTDGREAFVVFRNAATDAVNVLYRRKDGHLGLIEPEA